jgi:hypothetical protein
MNKQSPILFVALIAIFAVLIAHFALAAENKEGRVTQVVRDVHLLAGRAAARPATVNDNVREGTAVRTGDDSRAEITFTDQSLTRLGANTVFSFGQGTKAYNLGSGAILMYAPAKAGEVKIHTSAATAAVTGFTCMLESHPNAVSKLIILHGKAKVTFEGLSNEPCRLGDSQMIAWPAHPRVCPQVYDVDISKLLHGKLVKGFKNQLPEMPIFLNLIKNLQSEPPSGGLVDPTGSDAVDRRHSAQPPPMPTPPIMHSPPPKF